VPQLADLMLQFNRKEKLFNLKGIAVSSNKKNFSLHSVSNSVFFFFVCICQTKSPFLLKELFFVFDNSIFLFYFQLIKTYKIADGESSFRVLHRLQFEGRVLLVSWIDIRYNIQNVHYSL